MDLANYIALNKALHRKDAGNYNIECTSYETIHPSFGFACRVTTWSRNSRELHVHRRKGCYKQQVSSKFISQNNSWLMPHRKILQSKTTCRSSMAWGRLLGSVWRARERKCFKSCKSNITGDNILNGFECGKTNNKPWTISLVSSKVGGVG
jgi:hypothetical protein